MKCSILIVYLLLTCAAGVMTLDNIHPKNAIVRGQSVDITQSEVISLKQHSQYHQPDSAGDRSLVTINFDDVTAPCLFAETVALRNEYAMFGVTFEGPAPLDGGGILDECSNFSVTGYSPPNFLAFNADVFFSDGGIPRAPETIRFNPPANQVLLNAGSDGFGFVDLSAYDSMGSLVDSDSLDATTEMQTMSVSAPSIAYVVISYTGGLYPSFIVDDLTYEMCTTLTFDTLPDSLPVDGAYPGVTFSPGWIVWNSQGSSTYPPHSLPKVIYTHETDNLIAWDSDLGEMRFFVCIASGPADTWTYTVYDQGMNPLDSITFNTGQINTEVVFTSPGMRYMKVTGTGDWYLFHTIDDLYYCPLAVPETPTPLPATATPTNTPTAVPTDTPTELPTDTPTGPTPPPQPISATGPAGIGLLVVILSGLIGIGKSRKKN